MELRSEETQNIKALMCPLYLHKIMFVLTLLTGGSPRPPNDVLQNLVNICVKVVNFRNKTIVQFFLFEQTLMNAWMVHMTVTEMRPARTQKEVLVACAT